MSGPSENSAGVVQNNIKSAAETVLDWIEVVGPLLVSWPVVALVCLLTFHAPLIRVVERFTETPGSSAEIGAIKVVLRPTVLPPEFRTNASADSG